VTDIPAAGGTFAGATSGNSTLTGSCAPPNNGPERVYRWTPTASGVATIRTCDAIGTTFNTVLYIRQGDCGSGLEVACNDDTVGCPTATKSFHGSRITPSVVAGQTYFIVVDGVGKKTGTFTLTVEPPQ
jgi:hypothetical protein